MAGALLPLVLAAAAPGEGLEPFARLLGHCWEGEVAAGAIDVHCFEPVYGGAHVRDRHRVLVGGQAVYDGETLYSRGGGQIEFTYWNGQGGVGHGIATADAGGICFTGTMRASPAAPPQPLAGCWRWAAGGGYLASDGDRPPVRFTLSDKPG